VLGNDVTSPVVLTASPRSASPESGSVVAVGAATVGMLVLVGSLVAVGVNVGEVVPVAVGDAVATSVAVIVAVAVAVGVSVTVAVAVAVSVAVAVGASMVITSGAVMQNCGSDMVGATNTSKHA
jgi:hypothetical protein